MKITNQRSYALVIGGHKAGPGETIDVDSDLGKQAVKQSANWSTAKATKSTKKSDADVGDEKENQS